MNKIKKIVAVLAIVGLVGAAVPAQALTAEELLVEIQKLRTELDELLGEYQTLTGAPAVGVVCTFTRNLYSGVSGADVKCLQQYLNAAGFKLAETGAGSPGNETEYYGPRTQAAVQAWQDAKGVVYGAYGGYFGPLSRAKFAEVAVEPTEPTEPTEPEEPEEPGVEGALSVKVLPIPSGVEVGPSASNVAVAGLQLRAADSRITVKRIDLSFAVATTTLRNAISHVALYDGENALLGVDLSRDTVSVDGITSTVRFAPLNVVVPKDGSKDLIVRVTIPASPAITDTPAETITVYVGEDDVRGVDAEGLQQYNTGTVSRTFIIDTSLDEGVLTVKTNAGTPAEGVILGSQTGTTLGVELLRFEVKATIQPVTVEEITVALTDASSTVSYLHLYDGTNLLATEIAADDVTFEDLEVDIAKNATKVFRIEADLVELDDDLEGAVVSVLVDVAGVTGVDAEDNDIDSGGTATGENQYVYSVVPEITSITTTMTEREDPTTSTLTAWWDGTITFTLKALGGDIEIATATAASIILAGASEGTATATLQIVKIAGQDLEDAGISDRTISENGSKTIVASARISESSKEQYVWLYISTALKWNGYSLPTFMRERLVTDEKVFSK